MATVVIEKKLTATDVQHRLTFETASLPHFHFNDDVHHIDFKVLDLTDGSTRDLRLYKRKLGHPKPVISKGWRAYVKENGLRIGDKVIMKVNEYGGEAMFSIQAQRTDIMIWGEPDWYDIKICRCVRDCVTRIRQNGHESSSGTGIDSRVERRESRIDEIDWSDSLTSRRIRPRFGPIRRCHF